MLLFGAGPRADGAPPPPPRPAATPVVPVEVAPKLEAALAQAVRRVNEGAPAEQLSAKAVTPQVEREAKQQAERARAAVDAIKGKRFAASFVVRDLYPDGDANRSVPDWARRALSEHPRAMATLTLDPPPAVLAALAARAAAAGAEYDKQMEDAAGRLQRAVGAEARRAATVDGTRARAAKDKAVDEAKRKAAAARQTAEFVVLAPDGRLSAVRKGDTLRGTFDVLEAEVPPWQADAIRAFGSPAPATFVLRLHDPAAAPIVPARPPAAGQAGAGNPAAAGKAARVVFVVDASGSMLHHLKGAKAEVVKAIRLLPPGTLVDVVVDAEVKSAPLFPDLVPASPAAADAVATMLAEVQPGGPDVASACVASAVPLRPDVVWFVTDGAFNDEAKTLAKVAAAAKRGGFRVNTVTRFAQSNRDAVIRLAVAGGGVCVDNNGKVADPKGPAVSGPDSDAPTDPSTPSLFREP
jgi:hypothetical protein